MSAMNNEKLGYIEDKLGAFYKIGTEWVFAPSAGYGYKVVRVLANGDRELERRFIIHGDGKITVIKWTPFSVRRKSRQLLKIYNKEQAQKKIYIDELMKIVKEKEAMLQP
jgi:hypothetical protein